MNQVRSTPPSPSRDGILKLDEVDLKILPRDGMCVATRSATAFISISILLSPVAAFAQDEPRTLNIPNPMGAHTWFIIAAIGGFLLWCISYALQVQKEATAKKKSRDDLLRQREELLDQIADLEERREANAVDGSQYRREMKDLRHRLSRVLDSLGHPESQRSAKRGT